MAKMMFFARIIKSYYEISIKLNTIIIYASTEHIIILQSRMFNYSDNITANFFAMASSNAAQIVRFGHILKYSQHHRAHI